MPKLPEILSNGVANHARFFYRELEHNLSLDSLLMEAYIMVHRLGFSYSDVRKMVRTERVTFLEFYQDELRREEDAIKSNR